MVGTPGLDTTFGHAKVFGQGIETLETEFAGDMTFVLGEDLCAELLFEVLSDNPDNLAEASLDGIINTVIHDGLSVGAKTVRSGFPYLRRAGKALVS